MTVRLVPRPPGPEPRLELLEVRGQMRGLSGRVLSCGIYRTDLGLEAHCGYDEDLFRSEYAAEIGTAREVAEQCRQAVLAKGGLTELAEG
jgi:hypothetical protein